MEEERKRARVNARRAEVKGPEKRRRDKKKGKKNGGEVLVGGKEPLHPLDFT